MKYAGITTICIVATLHSDHAQAQCNITVGLTNTISCANTWGSIIVASINGGTPPFSITFQMNGSTVQTVSGHQSSTWSPTVPLDLLLGNGSVIITDSQGCQANGSTTWTPQKNMDPTLSTTYSCSTGAIVRWNGQFGYQSGCPGTTYSALNNGPMVAFPTNWTQESPTQWRLNQPLPQGSSTLMIAIGATERMCDGVRECYRGASLNASTDPGDCGVNFRLRASLDGAFRGNYFMGDELRSAGLVPLVEPYSALGYVFTGSAPGASISPAQLAVTNDNAIVDWVIVEVRSSSAPSQVLYSKAALLQKDHDVVDADGSNYVNCPSLSNGSYHVAIKHRNHLGVMTGSPRNLFPNPDAATIDLGYSGASMYGTNAQVLRNTTYCMWAGDVSGDGQLRYTGSGNDRDPILTAVGSTTPNNTLGPIYDRRDVNMDGLVRYTGTNNDRDPILTNVGSTTPNNTRVQQLP